MGLVAVTGVFKTPNGAVYPSATVAFERVDPKLAPNEGVVLVPDITRVTTDGAGAISINLMSGDYVASVITSAGKSVVQVTIPAVVATDIAAALATPGGSYEVISLAAFRNAWATAGYFPTIAGGVVGVADGALFLTGLNTTFALYRRAGANATPVWGEV